MLGHQLMQGVGPEMPFAAALPLGIAGLSLLPLAPQFERKTALRIAALALAGACAVALWVRLDPIADTVAVYSDTKV